MSSILPFSSPSRVVLVLGGARSGKSRHAEALLARCAGSPVYLATAQALDAEMAERIRRHRAARPPEWITVEEPLDIAGVLRIHSADPVLVDCLTLWLSNLIGVGRDPEAAADELTAELRNRSAPTILVANEVGLGIVPADPPTRRFRDAAGRLNQAVAAAAEQVVFVAAGLPLVLKDATAAAASAPAAMPSAAQ